MVQALQNKNRKVGINMAKITREQIENINKKCINNWRLDVQYYLWHNEKTLIKQIRLNEENYLEFTLRYNYKNQVSLHISKYHHRKGDYFASSEGLGKSKVLDETQITRKNINNLITFTENLTDDECMRINAETQVTKSCMFVASEEI